jgi:hypothetical protein
MPWLVINEHMTSRPLAIGRVRSSQNKAWFACRARGAFFRRSNGRARCVDGLRMTATVVFCSGLC